MAATSGTGELEAVWCFPAGEMKRGPSSPDFCSREHETFSQGAGNARGRNHPLTLDRGACAP